MFPKKIFCFVLILFLVDLGRKNKSGPPWIKGLIRSAEGLSIFPCLSLSATMFSRGDINHVRFSAVVYWSNASERDRNAIERINSAKLVWSIIRSTPQLIGARRKCEHSNQHEFYHGLALLRACQGLIM